MTKRNVLTFALGIVMGLALSIAPAQAGPRPSSELGLFSSLNGVQTRETNSLVADGGGLSLWSMDAGPGCNNVATGAVYEMHCNSAGHFCPWGSDGGAGLAFCGTTIGNVAYGRPVNASTPAAPAPYWFTTPTDLSSSTTNVCIVPKAGDLTMTCALFRMR